MDIMCCMSKGGHSVYIYGQMLPPTVSKLILCLSSMLNADKALCSKLTLFLVKMSFVFAIIYAV